MERRRGRRKGKGQEKKVNERKIKEKKARKVNEGKDEKKE
jgi:hypothetical protein